MAKNHTFAFQCGIMRYLGMGMYRSPHEKNFNNHPNLAYKIYTFFILFFAWCFVIIQVKSAILAQNVNEFFFSIAMFFGHGAVTFKSISWVYYNKNLQSVIYNLEVVLKNFYQNEERMRRCKIKYYFIVLALLIPAIFTLSTFVIIALNYERIRLNNLDAFNLTKSDDRILVLPHSSLVYHETDLVYALQLIFQLYGVYAVGVIIINADTFVSGLLIHIAANFENVQDYFNQVVFLSYQKLKTQRGANMIEGIINDGDDNDDRIESFDELENRIHEWYSIEEINEEICEKMKIGVNFHNIVLGCAKDLQTAYGISFLGQLVFSLSSICLTLWTAVDEYNLTGKLTTLRMFQAIGFFISLAVQLFIQTSGANECTLQAAKLTESITECRRYSTNKRLRRIIVMVIMKAQSPLVFHAMGFTAMSNRTYLEIMKSSYSAFAVLIRYKNNHSF